MGWDDGVVRPVSLAALGQNYRRYRLADPWAEDAMDGSLRRWGQLSAVVACVRAERLEVLDGFKRAAAAAQVAGLTSLSVRVLDVDERTAKAAILGLNRGQHGVRELEEAWIVQALVRDDGLTQVEAAHLLGQHKSWVCRRLALLERLSAAVTEDLRLGLLGPALARQLTRLPAGNQEAVLAMARREALTAQEVSGVIALLQGASDEQAAFVLAQPRAALQQAQPVPTALRDPRLSRAGNWLARHLTQALESLVRVEHWLRTPGARELSVRDEVTQHWLATVADVRACAKNRSAHARPATTSIYSPRRQPMKRRPKKNPQNKPTTSTTGLTRRDHILADFATLRVPVTADQLDEVLKQAQDAGWSHLEFLHRLVADQAGLRRQRRLERLIKDAHFREALPLSSFDWNFNPAIPRVKIEALAQGDFIGRKQNVVFVGQSGLGKSRLIQSIGLAACMLEQRVRYITSGELLEDLTAALADQTIHDRVRFYAKFHLLIIDEFGFDRTERAACPEAASLWYKIIDARSQRCSTALVTNIDFDAWADYLGDAPLAMAMLDRVVDGATIVKLKGKSYRVHRGQEPTDQ